MVPSVNSFELARRLPKAQLSIFPDAGHGGIFQNHAPSSSKHSLSFSSKRSWPHGPAHRLPNQSVRIRFSGPIN
jgi:hypothetical protein